MSETSVGRELDRWLAEHIMGLEVVGRAWAERDGEGWLVSDQPSLACGQEQWVYVVRTAKGECNCVFGHKYKERLFGHTLQCLDVVPPYYEDIAAAWQVVEKMRSLGYGIVMAGSVETHAETWRVMFAKQVSDTYEDYFRAVGATAPEAICRAALAAMDVA
jgi:hypothetical protein